MTVITRAGARRENAESSTVNTVNAEQKMGVEEPQDATQSRSCLLELPPELRNRIYHFASEAERITLFGTRVWTSTPPEAWATRGWQYFALTQTCWQIREEYRPLWLREKSLWMPFRELARFVDTFMPTESELKNAPKTIQVAWNHEVNGRSDERWDITPLIRLLAWRPDFHFEFIPYRVAMDIIPDVGQVCDYCMDMIEFNERGFAGNDGFYDHCECVSDDWDYKDWEIGEYDEMAYTEDVQAVAQNKNRVWLDAVRNGDITVEFFKKSKSERITIVIRCGAPRKGARDLLTKWGLDGSSNGFRNPHDYMVFFKSKKTFVSGSGRYETTDTVTREVCFTKVK